MWKRGLAPARIDETYATFLGRHECCGSLDSLPVMELKGSLLAMLVDQIVYRSHSRMLTGVGYKCTEDSTGTIYLAGYNRSYIRLCR